MTNIQVKVIVKVYTLPGRTISKKSRSPTPWTLPVMLVPILTMKSTPQHIKSINTGMNNKTNYVSNLGNLGNFE